MCVRTPKYETKMAKVWPLRSWFGSDANIYTLFKWQKYLSHLSSEWALVGRKHNGTDATGTEFFWPRYISSDIDCCCEQMDGLTVIHHITFNIAR